MGLAHQIAVLLNSSSALYREFYTRLKGQGLAGAIVSGCFWHRFYGRLGAQLLGWAAGGKKRWFIYLPDGGQWPLCQIGIMVAS